MDLNSLDTRQKAHEGADVPLVILGEARYGFDGKPITFRLRGVDDPELHQLALAQARAADGRTPDEVKASDTKICRAAVIGWSDNWSLGKDKLPFSKANIEKVLEVPLIRRFLAQAVFDRKLFTNGSSDEPSSTSDN